MEWVETTGKSIEEAKDLALDQLGVDVSDAEFEVLSDAKLGIFGRLKSEARVRARVRPTQPRPKDATNNKRRRNVRNSKGENDRGSQNEFQISNDDSDLGYEKSSSGVPSSNRSSGRKGSNKRQGQGSESTSRQNREKFENAEKDVESVEEKVVSLKEQAEVATTFLRGLFDSSSVSVNVSSEIDEENELMKVSVTGDNLGSFIGPRGVTLRSLQELTRTVVQRTTGARNGRIVVDVENYREKRRVALEQFTKKIADEVKSTKSNRVLEPMSPADRKIVHDVINDIDGVETTSEGDEPRRYVVVKPSSE